MNHETTQLIRDMAAFLSARQWDISDLEEVTGLLDRADTELLKTPTHFHEWPAEDVAG